MNFGKLQDISSVDFALPPEHERTTRVLEMSARSFDGPPRFYVGTTGWSNPGWIGKWYPAKVKPVDLLKHYNHHFNTIELNTTHYRIPGADLVDRWHDQVETGFLFCPKIPHQISHLSKLRAEEPTLRFAEAMSRLGNKLGPYFIQLPDHHGPGDLRFIQGFLGIWPQGRALHWELRHPDWFSASGGAAGEGWDGLEAAGHGTVITDVAGRRDVLHMQLTTPVVMLRFVGNGLHPTDYTRSDEWIARITDWSKRGLRAAFIFLHQPDMGLVPDLVGYWAKALNRNLNLQITVPRLIAQGIQGSLF
ncbi:MAG: hypothetical protein RLZZ165_450 [Bacteroidota bacterium]